MEGAMRTRLLSVLFCVVVLYIAGCGGGGGGVFIPPLPELTHSGVISANETWDAAHTHIVTGTVYVEGAASPVLTIEAGATVKVDAGCAIVIGYNDVGGLVAQGSALQRITFTANSAAPAKGFWVGIVFYDQALVSSIMDYCNVYYAGYDDSWGVYDGAIMVVGNGTDGTFVQISNCIVSYSAASGIVCGYGASFQNGSSANTVNTCDLYPVRIDARQAHTLETGTYSGNTIDRVWIDTEYSVLNTVHQDATWINPGIPFEVSSNLYVEGTGTPTLTLSPGSTFVFNNGYGIIMGWNDVGGLNAVGTAFQRIIFTGKNKTKGYWVGVVFYDQALSTSVMDYCTVEYAGYDDSWGVNDGAIMVVGDGTAGTSVKISNCIVTNSLFSGIVCGYGGSFQNDSTGNTVNTCNLYPVEIAARQAHTLESGFYTGNTVNRIYIDTEYSPLETVHQDAAWIYPGIPYEVSSNLYVEGTSSPTLTLSPGSTLMFNNGYGMFVGYNDIGALNAVGNAFQRITLTGKNSSKGYWMALIFYAQATTSTLSYCTVEYGGYDSGISGYSGGVDDDGNIIILDDAYDDIDITNSIIQHSLGYGITRGWVSTGGQPDFTAPVHANTFSDCDLGDQAPPR
jgi:hypothetical protein